jgi:hypothetical protein
MGTFYALGLSVKSIGILVLNDGCVSRCYSLGVLSWSSGFTTRRNPICGAPFWGLVVHLACATHIMPQVIFICGAPYYVRHA